MKTTGHRNSFADDPVSPSGILHGTLSWYRSKVESVRWGTSEEIQESFRKAVINEIRPAGSGKYTRPETLRLIFIDIKKL